MLPTITFIIPTLNSALVLKSCLNSIKKQDYPKDKIKIFIIDGGSTDSTLKLAHKFSCKIIPNPQKTAEAAKAIGVKQLQTDYVALVDSDNILPTRHWLKKMLLPLMSDSQLIGSEPIKFTYRTNSGYIERYSALLGANDPYAFFTGLYDRYSTLSQKWTGINLETKDFPTHIKITFNPNSPLPTIGANGTIFRTDFIKNNFNSNYFSDIDIISSSLNQSQEPLYFAKVKIGIIHSYCESSFTKFIRKQKRRISDVLTYQSIRKFNWSTTAYSKTNLTFGLYSLSLIFPLIDSVKGYLRHPDPAWFFHPLACLSTFLIYSSVYLKNKLGLNVNYQRTSWKQ